VNESVNMSSVGQCLMVISPAATRFLIKKYLTLICLVLLLLDYLPLVSRSIALIYWFNTDSFSL
jgi:hypothetical protein